MAQDSRSKRVDGQNPKQIHEQSIQDLKMERVVIESPFGSDDDEIIRRNILYARLCLNTVLHKGHACFASHLLFTQRLVLNDNVPEERALGITAGLEVVRDFEATYVFSDFGVTPGMQEGIDAAHQCGRRVEEYRLFQVDCAHVKTAEELWQMVKIYYDDAELWHDMLFDEKDDMLLAMERVERNAQIAYRWVVGLCVPLFVGACNFVDQGYIIAWVLVGWTVFLFWAFVFKIIDLREGV
jgi:hypothetical protein